MTKIKNKLAFPNKIPITDNDYVVGTNGDTIKKETRSFQVTDLRDYIFAGQPPTGGTLKITEIVYNGVLTTPETVANQLTAQIVLPYEIVILSVNNEKYQLKKQDITIGVSQIPLVSSDFIPISLVAKNLLSGISTYKGLNVATGREEHYSIGSVGLNITKELDGLGVETGRILYEQKQQTTLGAGGIEVYKGFNATTKLQEFYSLFSDNISITKELNGLGVETGRIKINTPTISEIPSIIINSAYTGTVETGSASKPFKTLQAGFDYLVGTGTNFLPERGNQRVLIQKGVGYVFTGVIEYNASITLEDGVYIESNPSAQDMICDLDKPAYTNQTIDLNITFLGNSTINLLKSGFRNKGTTSTGGVGSYKKISFLGSGKPQLSLESNVSSPSTRFLIASNVENTANFFNRDDVVNFDIESDLTCPNSSLMLLGGNAKVRLNGSMITSGTGSAGNVNANTKFIQIKNSASLELNDINLNMFINLSSTYNSVITAEDNSTLFMSGSRVLGNINNFLDILSTTSNLSMINNLSTSPATGNFINSALNINNLKFNGNTVSFGGISPTVDLTKGNTISVNNNIGNYAVESLVEYVTKSEAVLSGLPKGASLKVATPINAGFFILGQEHRIKTIGTTNFTLIGATSNTVGLYFTATSGGTGTGVADLVKRETI